MRTAFVLIALLHVPVLAPAAASKQNSSPADMALIPAGTYLPFYGEKGKTGAKSLVSVEPFRIDRAPVTNRQYLDFVRKNKEWRKSRVKRIYADSHYLDRWTGDLNAGDRSQLDSPVVNVSWFAAEAYCEWLGKSLPSTDQWEFTLDDQGRDREGVRKRILAWYSFPNPERLPRAGSGPENGYGVRDLTGPVWEWTLDFNSFMAVQDTRDTGERNSGLFCGGASLNATSAEDYAAFMRYSFRASLQAAYTGSNLGFRCAKEME